MVNDHEVEKRDRRSVDLMYLKVSLEGVEVENRKRGGKIDCIQKQQEDHSWTYRVGGFSDVITGFWTYRIDTQGHHGIKFTQYYR